MSGGGNQDDLLDLSFDPTGSCMPPPLRPPALSQAQLLAAIELGFSNKYLPTGAPNHPNVRNGRDTAHRQGSSEFGSYSAEADNSAPDLNSQFYSGDFTDGQGNFRGGPGGDEAGLLPPLRRPHINEIPPDVLAVLLKTARYEEILGPLQNQDSHSHPHPNSQSQGRGSPSEQSRMSSRNDNNNHNNYPQPHQQTQPPPQPHQQMSQQQRQQQPMERNMHNQGQGQSQSQGVMSPNSMYQQQQQHNSGRGRGGRGRGGNQSPRSDNNAPGVGMPGMASGPRKTGLSPMAKEFYPSSSMSMNMPRMPPMTEWVNPQDDAETASMADMAEAIAQFQLQTNTNQSQDQENFDFNNMGAYGDSGQTESFPEDNSDFVLSTVTDAITDLTKHPANFSRCAKSVTDVLKTYLKDLETFGVVVTLLVEQSISNPNFCYSGARLSNVLHKNDIAVDKTKFKKLLLQRCQEEFGNCVAKMDDPEIQMRCRGLLMFFGEILVNMKIETSPGVSAIILPIGLGVLEMMQHLVKDPVHENIKCVFQVLKLVGWELESAKDGRIKTNFEQLMKDLSYLCMGNSNIKPQTKLLLDSLFQIKNKKWNREETEETPKTPLASPASSTFSSSASNNIYELPESDEDDFGDDCILLDDEPEEVQRAYEDFLKAAKK